MRILLSLFFALIVSSVFSQQYHINEGTYVFKNVPASHPIAFHNENVLEFQYVGEYLAGSKIGPDGVKHTYFHGDITVFVTGDFNVMSYSCFYHGYMGGENNIAYDNVCGANEVDFNALVNIDPDIEYECISEEVYVNVDSGKYSFIGTYNPENLNLCFNESPEFMTLEEAQRVHIANNRVTKYLNSPESKQLARQNEEFYIPVVINLIHTGNYREYYNTFSGHDVMSDEHAEAFLERLNYEYNSQFGSVDSGIEGDSTYQTGNSRINFIKGDIDINGNPMPWVRTWDLSVYQDSLPPNATTCDSEDIPYYQQYIGSTDYVYPYDGPEGGIPGGNSATYAGTDIMLLGGCLSIIGEGQFMLDKFGYHQEEYLNINALIGSTGNIGGWAAFPDGGFRCFVSGSSYAYMYSTNSHEVGHWLGLRHTFGNVSSTPCSVHASETPSTCNLMGDLVCDTKPTDRDWDHCYNTFIPGVDTLFDKHCNEYVELLPDYSDGPTPSDHSNIMDYTNYCTQEGFTDGQMERARGFLVSSDRALHAARGRAIYELDPSSQCGDPDACNYIVGGAGDPDQVCLYLDAIGVCGGLCEFDVNSNGVCDDQECVGGDSNGNGICDDDDPCGTLTGAQGIVETMTGNQLSSIIAIGNRCWSMVDLHRVTFQDGSPISSIPETETIDSKRELYINAAEDEIPLVSHLNDYYDSKNSKAHEVIDSDYFNDAYVYNWYAVNDPRGLCPSGWHVSTDEDWKDLELAIGYTPNEVVRLNRNSDALSMFNLEDTRFLNSYVSSADGNAYYYVFPLAFGGLDKFGRPVRVGESQLVWTSDDYNTGRASDNALFRMLNTRVEYQPAPELPNTPITIQEAEYPGIQRLYQLGSTSGNKGASMSVRCVKDVN